MAEEDSNQQTHDDILRFLQMEALGIKRRDKITTADYKENRVYISVSQLEHERKAFSESYELGKRGKSKIADWKNIWSTIQDDGTTGPGDQTRVNEGLGQTHRAKLLHDKSMRDYHEEPDVQGSRYQEGGNKYSHKNNRYMSSSTTDNKSTSIHVKRERLVKGMSTCPTSSSGDPRALSTNNPSRMTKPMVKITGKTRAPGPKRSLQAVESFQRQQRVAVPATLVEPKAFMASAGFNVQALSSHSSPIRESVTSSQADSKTSTLPPSVKKAAPSITKQLISVPKSPKPTAIAEEAAGSARTFVDVDNAQQAQSHPPMAPGRSSSRIVSNPNSENRGAIPLDLMMSIGLKFTPEQLRLLEAHNLAVLPPITSSRAPTPSANALASSVRRSFEPPVTKPSATLDISSAGRSGATVVSVAMSTLAPVPISVSAFAPDSSMSPIATPLSNKPQSSQSSSPKTGHAAILENANIPVLKRNQPAVASVSRKSGTPVNLTTPSQSSAPTSDATAVLRSNVELASLRSRAESRRYQREMIIGPQVYQNRYSHIAGSLVDSFQRMTLIDEASVSAPKIHDQETAAPAPVAQSVAPMPAAQNTATIAPFLTAQNNAVATLSSMAQDAPAVPALRPRFVPSFSTLVVPGASPAPLAHRTVNLPVVDTNPFGPPRRGPSARATRSGAPSLPPHLVDSMAHSDPGAAARAQYGRK